MPKCQDCRFFDPAPYYLLANGSSKHQCRENGPTVSHHMANDTARWPLVVADDWCGKFQPKDTPGAG